MKPDQTPFTKPALVDAQGRPMGRPREDHLCPRCEAGPSDRRMSSGFGPWHDVCGLCGHEFYGERLTRPRE